MQVEKHQLKKSLKPQRSDGKVSQLLSQKGEIWKAGRR